MRNAAAPSVKQTDDESVVFSSAIAVSPMQAGYAPAGVGSEFVGWLLQSFAAAK